MSKAISFNNCVSIATGVFIIFLLTSCVDTKKATYFNCLQDADRFNNTTLPQTYIQPNDILNITVSSLNPEATTIFNPDPTSSSEKTGYLVEASGTILFPVLGSIKASGLTKDQLKADITQRLI